MRGLAFVLVLLLPTILFGEVKWEGKAEGGFSVQMQLSDNVVGLNQWVTLNIVLESPASYRVNSEAMLSHLVRQTDLLSFPFIIESDVGEPKVNGETCTQQMTFRFKTLRTGTFFLTFLTISFLPVDSKEEGSIKIASPIFQIRVKFPTVDETQLIPAPLLTFSGALPVEMSPSIRVQWIEKAARDVKLQQANVDILEEHAPPWKTLAAVFLLMAIAGGFYIALRLGFFKPLMAPPPDIQVEALKQLDDLSAKNLPREQHFDDYYVSLTSIVRRYIEQKFQLEAPLLTTEEFLDQARQSPAFTPITRQRLQDFLNLADRVKFARYHPTVDECHQAFYAAQEFILVGRSNEGSSIPSPKI